ncbi:hypothetical protein JVT61DRAFT_464 [Boletus reticuloceps]|uniref:Uncharacterized protein n=1 Tax=Boletus reticuloceps TaxID=495285 RepID=A0A8I2Z0Q0_9AGAM|nr:hypothetical protein JVT61DRAFT_464 [Boletus reticuloceps]
MATTAPSSTMSPASLLFATSNAKRLAHFSKPHRNEALLRLRNSTLCLVTLGLLTYLLPVPSLWTALNVVRGEGHVDVFWAVCAAEVALSGLLALNIIQAAVAIQYPRTPLPPLPSSPAKGLLTPQGQKKRRTILSPATSPQTQRSFTSSTPSPFGVSFGASTSSVPSTPSPSLAAYHGKHPPSLGRAFNGLSLSLLAGDSDDDS